MVLAVVNCHREPPARLLASSLLVPFPAASTGWYEAFAGSNSAILSVFLYDSLLYDSNVVDAEWHLKQSSDSRLIGFFDAYAGEADTPMLPVSAPDAVQPDDVGAERPESSVCGLWQSPHSACRLRTPANSSSWPPTCTEVAEGK